MIGEQKVSELLLESHCVFAFWVDGHFFDEVLIGVIECSDL